MGAGLAVDVRNRRQATPRGGTHLTRGEQPKGRYGSASAGTPSRPAESRHDVFARPGSTDAVSVVQSDGGFTGANPRALGSRPFRFPAAGGQVALRIPTMATGRSGG